MEIYYVFHLTPAVSIYSETVTVTVVPKITGNDLDDVEIPCLFEVTNQKPAHDKSS